MLIAKVLRAVRLDVVIALRHMVLDVIAGSAFMPRPLRYAVYRAMGLDIRTMNIFSGATITGSTVRIGRETFVNHGCYLDAANGSIEIGESCHLGPHVMILTATHEIAADGAAERESEYRTTTIGDRVWLGARVTVLPGAVVEPGCVVASGAVVTGRCASGGVYAGVPARRIREHVA